MAITNPIKPGREVFYHYVIPVFNTQVSGYGRVLHHEAIVGTDDAYAIERPDCSVIHVRAYNVEEILQ